MDPRRKGGIGEMKDKCVLFEVVIKEYQYVSTC